MMKFQGISKKEAEKRIEIYGPNEIRAVKSVSVINILLRQIKNNLVIYLLFFTFIASLLLGKGLTAYVVLFIIFLVITMGFIQEYRAEKSIQALKDMLVPVSIVIRDGKEQEVQSSKLVPGDLIVLRTGEKIPADCVILESQDLKVDESILTGESIEILKKEAKNEVDYTNENLLFMGAFITQGRCIAKIIHTGMNTEFGKIAKMVSTAEKELPLQKKINYIARYMVLIAIIVSVLTGVVMGIRSISLSYDLFVEIMLVVIALSISAFPEGLPVVLTTTLASGAYRMAKKNAVVNRMSIIETLGETTVVCVDKTGTLTKGEMTVKKIFTGDTIYDLGGIGYEVQGGFSLDGKKVNPVSINSLHLLLKTAVMCNDSIIERKGTDKEYSFIGTPTEAALLIMSAKAGIFKETFNAERLGELPFSSERKFTSVLCSEGKEKTIYSIGAPEILLKRCKFVQKGEQRILLDETERLKILLANHNLSSKGYRVVSMAYKTLNSNKASVLDEELIFLGLASMEDPPREEVKASIELCKSAGITIKMITGDHLETALSIAKRIGIKGKSMEGEELDKLSDEEIAYRVKDVDIFARVRPEHKLRIVRALKLNGEIVTMTGDGVNDAPAIKEAHIGVAMGKKGTDVSRESSDLVLKDDNFSTIVSAITEGRTIFNNLRKFVTYQLSCSYSELLIIFLGILFGLPLPLLALQILFMNIVTDDLPAITLGLNPSSLDVMKAKPRKKSEVLGKSQIFFLLLTGTIVALGTLGVFYYNLKVLGMDVSVARTHALLTLIFFEIVNAFNFRSFRYPMFKLPIFSNKYLVYASIASLLITIAVIYTPANVFFETTPLAFSHWVSALLVSLSAVIVFDIFKILNKNERIIKTY